MPFTRWNNLSARIIAEHLSWEDVRDDLLRVIQELDSLRKGGLVPEGKYRQKGNAFKDTIAALAESRCGVQLTERRVSGRTDIHTVDITLTVDARAGRNVSADAVVIAGELKMIGSPEHRSGEELKPERTISIDIDKRVKEVKYTPVDLKRYVNPETEGGWGEFVEETFPLFFSGWMMRLASADRLEHIVAKLEGMTEYNNFVAAAIYKEKDGRYHWVDITSENPKILGIGELIDRICHLAERIE